MSETPPRNSELSDTGGPRAFSVAEVGRRLNLSRDSVYALLNSGRLRSVTLGRRRVIPASALSALLDAPDAGEE